MRGINFQSVLNSIKVMKWNKLQLSHLLERRFGLFPQIAFFLCFHHQLDSSDTGENMSILFLLAFCFPLICPILSLNNIQAYLNLYNRELKDFNHAKAEIAWNISLGYNEHLSDLNKKLTLEKDSWNTEFCNLLHYMEPENFEQFRQVYLICQGPRFTPFQLGNIVDILTSLSNLYTTTKVCIKPGNACMRIEPQLNKFMEENRDEELLRTAWVNWHRSMGTRGKPLYLRLIDYLNAGAIGGGYTDMGHCWRQQDQITIPLAKKLDSEVDYLYGLLHTFVRHKLSNYYSIQINDAIPTHLLGHVWAQRWDSLLDIIYEKDDTERTSEAEEDRLLQRMPKSGEPLDMVKTAEKFFISMGFPHLTKEFYANSVFSEKEGSNQNCHGSAAQMFAKNDFRLLMCAQKNSTEDFLIFHHELGHIYYFMAYSHLPTVFQDGASSSFHEGIGDTIGISLRGRGIKGLLRTALEKLPQIKYGLIMDLWRWSIFKDKAKKLDWNGLWWEMNYKYLGVKPPKGYRSDGLDPLGKFHIVDNIPYIRYFFASFLQFQFYEHLCEGKPYCSLEGNTRAGKKLWKMLEKGSSQHWTETLREFTEGAEDTVISKPLLDYFEPLKVWLEKKVRENGLKIGW